MLVLLLEMLLLLLVVLLLVQKLVIVGGGCCVVRRRNSMADVQVCVACVRGRRVGVMGLQQQVLLLLLGACLSAIGTRRSAQRLVGAVGCGGAEFELHAASARVAAVGRLDRADRRRVGSRVRVVCHLLWIESSLARSPQAELSLSLSLSLALLLVNNLGGSN